MALNKTKILASAQKYVQRGAFDKAIREYLRIIEEDPKDVRTLLRIGDLHARRGDAAAAAKTYDRVAQTYTEQGFFQKAVAVYKQILKVDPAQFEINQKLAELYQQLGLISNAMEQFQILAGFYERQGRAKETLQIFQRIVALDPDNIASRVRLAELLAREGRGDESIAEFERACAQLLAQSRLDDYIKVAERLLFLDPGKVEETRRLAKVYLDRGDARRALGKLQICFKADPRQPETLSFLGETFRALGQLPKAISVWKELAKLYGDRGQDAERARVLERIRSVAPEDSALSSVPPAPRESSGSHASSSAAGRALREVSASSASRAPAVVDVDKLLGEADVYLEYGLVPKAREHLARALSFAPSHPGALERMVKVAERMGDGAMTARAMAAFAHVLPAGSTRQRTLLEQAFRADPGSEAVVLVLEALGLPIPAGGVGRASRASRPFQQVPAIQQRPGAVSPESASSDVGEEIIIVDDDDGPGDETVFGPPPGFLQTVAVARAVGSALPSSADGAAHRVSPPTDLEELEVEMLAVDEEASGAAPRAGEDDVDRALDALAEIEGAPWAETEALLAGSPLPSLDDLHLDTGAFLLPEAGDRTVIAAAPPGFQDGPTANSNLELMLGEADFFLEQGLYQEARLLLERLATDQPGRPEVLSRLQAVLRGESGGDVAGAPDGAQAVQLEERFDDLTELGVADSRPEDAETHYDLGIAYKEMGLLQDAIQEFTLAMVVPARELDALVRIGGCMNEQGRYDDAIRELKRGLASSKMNDTAAIDFYYGMGLAYDGLGDAREALYYFRRVQALMKDHGDVSQRIVRLSRTVDEGGAQDASRSGTVRPTG